MKKQLLLFLFLSAMTTVSMAQNDATLYIYRNDGTFNAFLCSGLDSIAYSCIDMSGLSHRDWQTCEIHTPDSIHRIPLAAIDSIGFRAPEEFFGHTCPDANHPHAVDLGLPSGTKWSCCNVEASAPEDFGGYYAWGETEEKTMYSKDTYAYYDSSTDEYVNIGADISGTSYDVAHVKMGAPWRMPSMEQIIELMNSCSRQWTALNGVSGILVVGKNGGSVFFPAAGYWWDDNLYLVKSYGLCWSSSLYSGNNSAYGLGFCSDYSVTGYYADRYHGDSVRAVCP